MRTGLRVDLENFIDKAFDEKTLEPFKKQISDMAVELCESFEQIVEAHAELLKNERILDLEDQVKSLVTTINKLEREKEEMWQRVRNYVPSAD